MLLYGDRMYPQMVQIMQILEALGREMKTGLDPKNVEEQDEEQTFCQLSEKLAAVLELLNTLLHFLFILLHTTPHNM